MPLSGHFEFGLQMVASKSNEIEFLLSFPTRFIMGIFAMSAKFTRANQTPVNPQSLLFKNRETESMLLPLP
jgi:hypothetical protein